MGHKSALEGRVPKPNRSHTGHVTGPPQSTIMYQQIICRRLWSYAGQGFWWWVEPPLFKKTQKISPLVGGGGTTRSKANVSERKNARCFFVGCQCELPLKGLDSSVLLARLPFSSSLFISYGKILNCRSVHGELTVSVFYPQQLHSSFTTKNRRKPTHQMMSRTMYRRARNSNLP